MGCSTGCGVIITTESGEILHFFDGDMTTPACWPTFVLTPFVETVGAASARFIVLLDCGHEARSLSRLRAMWSDRAFIRLGRPWGVGAA
jgi:hypothetical protein